MDGQRRQSYLVWRSHRRSFRSPGIGRPPVHIKAQSTCPAQDKCSLGTRRTICSRNSTAGWRQSQSWRTKSRRDGSMGHSSLRICSPAQRNDDHQGWWYWRAPPGVCRYRSRQTLTTSRSHCCLWRSVLRIARSRFGSQTWTSGWLIWTYTR